MWNVKTQKSLSEKREAFALKKCCHFLFGALGRYDLACGQHGPLAAIGGMELYFDLRSDSDPLVLCHGANLCSVPVAHQTTEADVIGTAGHDVTTDDERTGHGAAGPAASPSGKIVRES